MGMGLVVGDKLARGARGIAGEIGYLRVSSAPSGRRARHGFARAVAEAGSRPRQLSGSETVDSVTVAREVFRRAAEGDTGALAVVERQGRIGEAIAAVRAVVDPQLVLLGGPIDSAAPSLSLCAVRADVPALARNP